MIRDEIGEFGPYLSVPEPAFWLTPVLQGETGIAYLPAHATWSTRVWHGGGGGGASRGRETRSLGCQAPVIQCVVRTDASPAAAQKECRPHDASCFAVPVGGVGWGGRASWFGCPPRCRRCSEAVGIGVYHPQPHQFWRGAEHGAVVVWRAADGLDTLA